MEQLQFQAICLFTLVLGLTASAGVQAAGQADNLFESNDLLEVTFSGPMRALSRDRADSPEERPGQLSYLAADGQTLTLEVTFEPRGNSRRDRKVCTFPPLWVHFDKSAVKGTLFEKQNKLKAVTYCRSPVSFQDYVIKEYLVYRMLNELTDASFRVRLLKITFQEADGKGKPLERYGFFIEHKKRLAKRLDMKVAEPTERISPNTLVPEQAALAELFQFMVSNTDFSFIAPPEDDTCCHNAVLFRPRDSERDDSTFMPVPYDFDRTGLVNPPNGEPALELGQRSFRDRVYRGFCRDPAYLAAALDTTRASRQALEALFTNQEELSQKAKDDVVRYLAKYYEIIDDPRRAEKALKCRGMR